MVTPYILLDSASEHGGTLRLYQRGEEFSIRVDSQGELMNSRAHHSEEALAELACSRIASHDNPHLLVGGLGMGFTLRAALTHASSGAQVMVAELMPAVVRWNRDYLGGLADSPLNDPRVTVMEQDIGKVMRKHRNGFDAIMLDVDNGPDSFTCDNNEILYGERGLCNAFDALKPNGVLTVWSAAPDAPFGQRLRKIGFDMEERKVQAHPAQRSRPHTIWIATRPE